MMHVGITGGVGSGKTTTCKIFAMHGVPILYADEVANQLMTTDPEVIQKVKNLLGAQAYTSQGPDKKYIAQKIYTDPKTKSKLEDIIHPAVADYTLHWQQSQSQAKYTLQEAAIMIQTGSYKSLDQIIVVTSPKETRIQRLQKSRGYSSEKTKAIMDNQLSDQQMRQYADFEIFNTPTQSLILQVAQTHQKLLDLSCNY